MEFASWLMVILAIPYFLLNRDLFHKLEGQDYFAIGIFLSVVISAFAQSDIKMQEAMDSIGSARWVILFLFLPRIFVLLPDRDRYLKYLAVLTIVVSIYAIVQSFTGIDLVRGQEAHSKLAEGSYRAQGFFNITMTFAHSFVMLFVFMTSMFLYARKKNVLMALAVVLLFISLYLTYTRGVWISGLVSILFLLYYYSKKILSIAAATGTLLFGIMMFFSSVFNERVATLLDFNYNSNSLRLGLWHVNWLIFKDNPILGVGYRLNTRMQEYYYQGLGLVEYKIDHAHNTILQFLAGTGLVGFSMFAGFIYMLVRSSHGAYKDNNRPEFIGFAAVIVALIVGGLTECNFQDAEVKHMFLFLYTYFIVTKWTGTEQISNI